MKMKTVITALSASHESRAAAKFPENRENVWEMFSRMIEHIFDGISAFNYGKKVVAMKRISQRLLKLPINFKKTFSQSSN